MTFADGLAATASMAIVTITGFASMHNMYSELAATHFY
jgi:hypothetical protein